MSKLNEATGRPKKINGYVIEFRNRRGRSVATGAIEIEDGRRAIIVDLPTQRSRETQNLIESFIDGLALISNRAGLSASTNPIFELVDGEMMPQLTGEPDGVRYFTPAQAAQSRGGSVARWERVWDATFGWYKQAMDREKSVA